ncbi:MAG: ATP-binding protein [Candidatus Woesearchaeota archaeon]
MKKRKLYPKLLKEKNKKEISIIIGARQVGKTTILKELQKEISNTNKTLFLDLDIISNLEKIQSFETTINYLKLNGYEENQKDFFYLFLDEFQRYKDISILMKNIYDNTNNIKIYATGSSSLQIKNSIQESLAGRKKINYLYPLDFEEFLWFKENEETIKFYNNMPKVKGENISIGKIKTYLEEFMIYGSYPAVVLSKKIEEKKEKLNNIFDLYIKKELVEYLAIKKILGAKKVIEYLAINNGQKTQFEEITNSCELSVYEVKQFIEILNETFITIELRPFFTNKNKELVKMPKIYFIDNGVRNYFINNFNPTKLRSDVGFLFEGFIISELLKSNIKNLKYWQNKKKQEVDIIIDNVSEQIAIEIKHKEKLKKEDYKNLDVFKEEYSKSKLKLINLGIQKIKENKEILIGINFTNRISK